LRLGGLDLTVIASKEEAETETRTLTPSGDTARPIVIAENAYARNRFYFYETPDVSGRSFYDFWGVNPGFLIETSEGENLRVFVDTQDAGTIAQRPWKGYALAGLDASTFPGADAELGAASDSLRNFGLWPANFDSTGNAGNPGAWQEIPRDDIGFVTVQTSTQTFILGFYFRNFTVDADDAIAVMIDRPNRFGAARVVPRTEVRLRLIRHPEQEQGGFTRYPTAPLMMRHVYVLGSSRMTNLTLKIARSGSGIPNPDVPPNVQATTYLHMFGLDDFDAENTRRPDGVFDIQNPNLTNTDEGFLFLPGPRPFSPPDSIVIERLVAAGVTRADATTNLGTLFGGERVETSLYTLPERDPGIPALRFQMEAVTSGAQTDITLPLEALEGSEVVKLDGRTLSRGADYEVDPAGGRITLRGDALTSLTPASRLEVSYQFRPLFGGGKSTLMGMSAEYGLGNRGKLAGALLYQSTGVATRRPKLGEEPTRALVGGLNGTLRFQPRLMTRLMNLLPFTDAGAASNLNFAGEIAASQPNPNTRNDAYVEDLEGADDSAEQNLARTSWAWASPPIDDDRRALAGDDTLRVPVAFYNPTARVRAGHLNPELHERERNDGLQVLELGFDRRGFARRDTLASQLGMRELLWSGVMRSFGTVGIDLTRTKSIEFWLNDKIGVPAQRNGRLHIDFGRMSEDFVFQPSPLTLSPRFNREAPTREEFIAADHDLGWDLANANCPDNDRDAEALPFGSECFRPSALNADDQFFLANGTEKNNEYDTEDLNRNGVFDETNSYFTIALDLADLTHVVTDVTPQYGNDPNVPEELRAGFEGWRKYRIDIDPDSLPPSLSDPGQSRPNLRNITFLRLWFEDTPGTPAASSIFNRNIQIHDLRLTQNQWLDVGFFAVDSTIVEPEPAESFSIGVINNKDDVEYELPPDAEEIDEQGIQGREQSLRIDFKNLEPGHEVLAERTLAGAGRGLDFTQYRRLTYFVHYRKDPEQALPDSAEFFFRVGTDTLNYYEVSQTIAQANYWQPVTVQLDQLTNLKFPEDVEGAVIKTLVRGTQRIVQVSAPANDLVTTTLPLRVTRRGNPSLQTVLRLFVGVRNLPPGAPGIGLPPGVGHPVSGQVWFDNVRLEEVEKERGLAQNYSVIARFSDVLDASVFYTRSSADFRSLQQRLGSNLDQESRIVRFGLSDLGRIVPTLGLAIPAGFEHSWNRALPKFFQNSDTRNTDERRLEQRTENVGQAFNFSVMKKPSRLWINKITLDRLQFSFSERRTLGRTFVSRDTSTTRTRNLGYDLSPRERAVPLWGKQKLNLIPTNIKFSLTHSVGRTNGFNVLRVAGNDSLVRKPSTLLQSMDVRASGALRPVQFLNIRYDYNEPRTFRRAHPYNERERLRLWGYDFGLPGNRSERFNFDFTPRPIRVNLTLAFSDNRIQQGSIDSLPPPDLHNSSQARNVRVSFDFGLHRRVLGLVFPRSRPQGQRPPEVQRPVEPQEEQPPPIEEQPPPDEGGGEPRRDFAPQEPHADSTAAEPEPPPPSEQPEPPPLEQPEPDSTGAQPPPFEQQPADSLGGEPPAFDPQPTDPDSLATQPPLFGPLPQQPGSPATPPGATPPPVPPAPDTATAPAPADSVTAPGRKVPNPIDLVRGVIRTVAGIEAIKVEWNNSATTGYTNLPDAPYGPFRYGWSKESGLEGSERYTLPPAEDRRNIIDLSTGIPLRGALRIAARYKRDEAIRTARSFTAVGEPAIDRLSNTNQNHRLDVTFPSLDLTLNGVEKLPLFRRRLQSSTLQLQFARAVTENFSVNQLPGGPTLEATGRSDTERLAFTANWNGQWKRGVSSTFSLNQTNNISDSPGTRREGVSRTATASVRFKVAPQGGLKLPFVRGGLKGGMDISLNGSFNTDDAMRFNAGSPPIRESSSNVLTLGARGDYTLSRNMSGGVELGYGRTARDDIQEQIIHTVRLGFNLTFLF
jgi:hypothetical protein